MAYIDKNFYDTTYIGESVAEADFSKLEQRASHIIDTLTFNRIADITALATYQQDMVKMAVASQVEYLQINGGASILNESKGGRATLGKYSEGDATSASDISPVAISYLSPTGLMYRGLNI